MAPGLPTHRRRLLRAGARPRDRRTTPNDPAQPVQLGRSRRRHLHRHRPTIRRPAQTRFHPPGRSPAHLPRPPGRLSGRTRRVPERRPEAKRLRKANRRAKDGKQPAGGGQPARGRDVVRDAGGDGAFQGRAGHAPEGHDAELYRGADRVLQEHCAAARAGAGALLRGLGERLEVGCLMYKIKI
uniref:(northern house mosquito) hypothetical protein n=1 Tax=Culex pipiens TaxID=7175 RepID=A0A8D8G380_CULPI